MRQTRSVHLEETIRLSDIRSRTSFSFDADYTEETLERLSALLDLIKLSKLKFRGEFEAENDTAIRLTASLGATAVQSCILTLAPVTTRVDVKINQQFLPAKGQDTSSSEIEIQESDPEDFLPDGFSLFDLVAEHLALELPEYPRAEGATLSNTVFTEPGKKPMTDEDARPFAELDALRKKLAGDDDAT
ncbi:MAG: YceD family protein [Pseudomonadota bacterium]